jgi:2-keto-3-deoxy-6-phosphogluconate aldolase
MGEAVFSFGQADQSAQERAGSRVIFSPPLVREFSRACVSAQAPVLT